MDSSGFYQRDSVFLPGCAGSVSRILALSGGITENTVRGTFEVAAIWLMGAVVAVFLLRVIVYKLHTDIVMLVVSIGFLSREIHFAGTDTGVYVSAVIAISLAWVWRDNIPTASNNGWIPDYLAPIRPIFHS